MTTSFNDEHFSNVSFGMEVIEGGMMIVSSAEHSEKTDAPSELTVDGITSLVSDEHPLKHE